MSATRITPAVGTKFELDGTVREFKGNSIVCPVPTESQLFRECERVQQRLRSLPFADTFAHLPPDSFHMTLFDLLCDQVRTPEHWSSQIPLDAPIERTDELLAELLEPLEWPEAPRMTVTGLGALGGDHTVHLHLKPTDASIATALNGFRDRVSQATGIRHPNHDAYFFHISLAYPLRRLDEVEAYRRFEVESNKELSSRLDVVELGQPYLTLFNDMFDFPERRDD